MTLARFNAATRLLAEERFGVPIRKIETAEEAQERQTQDLLRERGMVMDTVG